MLDQPAGTYSAYEMLQDEITAWFEHNPGPWNDVDGSSTSRRPDPSPDEFDEDIDQRSYDMASVPNDVDPLEFITTEVDWRAMFRDAPTPGISARTHSDLASTVVPESPTTVTSEETAVNPSAIFPPSDNLANKEYASPSITPEASARSLAFNGFDPSTSIPGPEEGHGERPAYDGDGNESATQLPRTSAEKNFICPHCGCGMPHKYNMNVHIKTVHYGIREYRCPAPGCDKEYTRGDTLKKHIQSKHSEQGPPHREDPKM
ncbi:hypothetical protein C8Q79DRAFT_228416 [Trametes meyenii]|nr:hypothetical protein C8Q79DRAFT_228416 [Trametes meyenii]